MHRATYSFASRLVTVVLLPALLFSTIWFSGPSTVFAQDQPAAPALPAAAEALGPELRLREQQLIHAVNIERRAAGLPPVRLNRELSEAAQWFAWDTVENAFNCDSTDSLGRGPGTRLRSFGYTRMAKWREVYACGFTEPKAAVFAWMKNSTQRSHLLDPELREAGAGYFYNAEKGRGFIALDLSVDEEFGPAIINNEAITTTNSLVTLFLHPQTTPTVAIKVSNDPTFAAASWQAATVERSWELAPGQGWRTVYVLTRNAQGRTALVSDMIFVGDALPREELSLEQASNIGSAYGITSLPGGATAQVRLSQGWALEDSDESFEVIQGASSEIDDPQASGGRATVLYANYREGLARGTTMTLPLNRLLTAFFRLKVADEVGSAEVARVTVLAGGMEHGPLILRGSDFPGAGQYAEFHVDFAYPQPVLDARAEVRIYRTGQSDVTVDVVRFFGQPMPPTTPLVWSAESDSVRSQGLWGRFESSSSDGYFDVAFTPLENPADLLGAPRLAAQPGKVIFESVNGQIAPISEAVVVCGAWCADIAWQASTNSTWLRLRKTQEGVIVWVEAAGLTKGVYYGTVNVEPLSQSAAGQESLAPTAIAVELRVDGAEPLEEEDIVSRTWLPVTMK